MPPYSAPQNMGDTRKRAEWVPKKQSIFNRTKLCCLVFIAFAARKPRHFICHSIIMFKKAGLFKRRKHKPLFIEIHRTTRGILMLYLYFRVSGTIGPGFSGAARFSLSRRAHVKAKSTLDSVEHKNYAVGEQKVGQPRRPTSCVLSFVLA